MNLDVYQLFSLVMNLQWDETLQNWILIAFALFELEVYFMGIKKGGEAGIGRATLCVPSFMLHRQRGPNVSRMSVWNETNVH